MGYGKIDIHDFYCLHCGNKVYSCVRPQAKRRERLHRKKLYCPWCKVTLNCVECRDDQDVFEFKTAFENGEYKEECKLSIMECDSYGKNIRGLGSPLRA